ncbi:Uncharacterised protein [Streptococcus pneumoniae]|nr:Uncharacterised protein [Streptococcus pneumoniae]
MIVNIVLYDSNRSYFAIFQVHLKNVILQLIDQLKNAVLVHLEKNITIYMYYLIRHDQHVLLLDSNFPYFLEADNELRNEYSIYQYPSRMQMLLPLHLLHLVKRVLVAHFDHYHSYQHDILIQKHLPSSNLHITDRLLF